MSIYLHSRSRRAIDPTHSNHVLFRVIFYAFVSKTHRYSRRIRDLEQNPISIPTLHLRYTKEVKLPCSPNMADTITYQEDVHATQGMGRN